MEEIGDNSLETLYDILQETKRVRPKTTYIHILLEDTGFLTIRELRSAMMDKDDWQGRIHTARAGA